jgi:hypothetical protein
MSGSCGGQVCEPCGFRYFCFSSMTMAAAVEGTRIPHRVCRYSNFYESVMAPRWCTELRNVLSDYYVPESKWPGYFEAVRAGTLPLDDLKLMLDLAGDGEQ